MLVVLGTLLSAGLCYGTPIEPCCVTDSMYVDLLSGHVDNTLGSRMSVVSAPAQQAGGHECSMRAVLKVNFEKLTSQSSSLLDGCINGPMCGHRMLRIDFELSHEERAGWMFNVGDSESNDGYGGDRGHQDHDVEVDGINSDINVWASDMCHKNPNQLAHYVDSMPMETVQNVSLFVADEYLRVTNDNKLDKSFCHQCLFSLNGEPDSSYGGPNENIYVGINRVVGGTHRSGHGVCSVKLSWVCPWTTSPNQVFG